MQHIKDAVLGFLSARRWEVAVLAIWLVSLLPGLIVSIRKGDPAHATVVVMFIQFFASFGSITLFGVITQILGYKYIESVRIHDRMMDGLFYGFHLGMVIWIFYAFYHILFGRKIIGDVNDLVAFFGVTCVLSCIAGIVAGFFLGKVGGGKKGILD